MDVGELRLGGAGVGEVHAGHLEDGLVLGLHALEVARLWELPRHARLLKRVVAGGLRHLLDKLREVATVELELAVLVVDDVRAHGLEEARVVRHDH